MDSKHTARNVLKQEIKGLQALSQRIDATFERALHLLDVNGKIVLSGVGKSGHICRKLAATLTSLGRPAIFVHPTEAAHGDMALLGKDDALLILSRSGKASELVPLLHYARDHKLPTVLMSEIRVDGLSVMVDCTLKLPRVDEAWGHAPTTSTVMQMALGDAIAVALAERNGWTEEDFKAHHPGGELAAIA